MTKIEVGKQEILVIVVSAIIGITLCTRLSPIYTFTGWYDTHCFFTVGKSMLRGMVPYRDLFEQKGPLLYMIHALAALVSWKTLLGAYIQEVLACGFFLFFSYKLMRLYNQAVSILTIPVLTAIVYSAPCFLHSVEELSLPFLAYALYIGVKTLQNHQMPTKKESFFIGVTAACVLWMKFTLLGFYFGWICVPAILFIKHHKVEDLIRMLAWIACGILAVTIPIFIYFGCNHAIKDLFTVYFYDNIFLYSNIKHGGSIIQIFSQNLKNGFLNFQHNNIWALLALLFAAVFLAIKKKNLDFWFLITCAMGEFLLVYSGGRQYRYYSMILSAFLPMGLVSVYSILQNTFANYPVRKLSFRLASCLVCVACLLFIFAVSRNADFHFRHKMDFPQYQFADIIKRKPDATLLNYGFLDAGFYTVTGIVPNCKFFCRLNMPLKEMMMVQDDFVKNGKVDFVVTMNSKLKSDMYKCIKTVKRGKTTYFLYELIKIGDLK